MIAEGLLALANAKDPAPEPTAPDHWLTPAEAALVMGVTPRRLARRWRRLPFCHQLPAGRGGYRVSGAELQRAMERRA